MSKALCCYSESLSKSTIPSLGLLALRCVAGTAMMLHGWGKIQAPFSWMGADAAVPAFLQFLAALSEFGGGIAWIVGLLFPLASFGILCTMAVATYTHMIVRGDPFVGMGGPSYELALVYFAVSVLFLTNGPGRFAIDRYIISKRRHKLST